MSDLEDALADVCDPGLEAELDHRVTGLQLQLWINIWQLKEKIAKAHNSLCYMHGRKRQTFPDYE